MRSIIPVGFIFIAAVLVSVAIVACTPTQISTAQGKIVSGQLVIDTAACDLQKAANDANTIATAAGNSKVANIATLTSVASGAACMTLASPVPAATSPPAAPTTTGDAAPPGRQRPT